MTEPVDVLILNALMARLTSPALTGSPPVASPNVAYAPTIGTAYLDARPIIRAAPDQPGHANDSLIVRRGVFQVDAVVPQGYGDAPGLRLAALVAARFAVGTALDTAAGRLKITDPPTIAASIKDGPWVRYPVGVPYLIVS